MKKSSIIGAIIVAASFPIAVLAQTQISLSFPGANYSTSTAPGTIVNGFYVFMLLIGGVLAFGAIIYGGVKYMTAAGNPSSQSEAKEWILSALLGILLLGCAYLILYTINPNLVHLDLPTLAGVNISAPSSGGPPSVSGAGGKCQAPPSGPCTVANLANTCMAANAQTAAGVCNVESNGNAAAKSGTDKCDDGSPVSFGLFQVNISANTLPGLNCPSAFSNAFTGHNPHCTILNQQLYQQCAAAAQNAAINIQKACQLSNAGNNWNQWGPATKNACNL